MSDGEVGGKAGDAGCEVLLLVRHPTEPSVLSEVPADGQPEVVRLPTVLTKRDPDPADYLPAAFALLGERIPLLRANGLVWVGRGEATVLLAETEPYAGAGPAGLEWRRLDRAAAAAAEPAAAREALAAWVVERDSGWSPLRPPWSRAGWLARAGSWMSAEMTAAGLAPPGAPEVVQLWGISAVLRADSPAGAAYLKCSTDLFRHEAVLTRALAASMPGVLPDVIAVEPDEGWLLMDDMGGELLGDVPVSEWAAALGSYVPLQQQWLGRGDELVGHGAFVRPVSDLVPAVTRWSADDTLLRRLSPELRERWVRSVPRLVDACGRLDEIGPASTLVHGDLHAWNVVRTAAGFRYFDWTDAALSHPFVDLAPFVPRIASSAVRHAAYDAYLAGWADHLSPALLQEAGRLGLVVGCLYVTRTYLEGLPTLMPGDAGPLAGADVDWLEKTLDALDHHLDPPPR